MSKLDWQQVLPAAYDDVTSAFKFKGIAGSLVPDQYDYLELTYVPSGNGVGQVQTVTYKLGGSSGATVATLTLTYDASSNVQTITRT